MVVYDLGKENVLNIAFNLNFSFWKIEFWSNINILKCIIYKNVFVSLLNSVLLTVLVSFLWTLSTRNKV